MSKVKQILKGKVRRKDLYTYLVNNLENQAKDYLNNWHDMYPKDDDRSIRKKIEEDLDNFHNPAEEYQKAEKALNRKLADEEIDVIFRAFNETVIDLLEDKLSKV